MSDEVKEEKKCSNCQVSREYKMFLLTILATFVGSLIALSLYHGGLYPQTPSPCYCQSYEAYEFDEFPEDEVEVQKPQKQVKHQKLNEHKAPAKSGK